MICWTEQLDSALKSVPVPVSSTIDGREDHLESFLALFECLLASAVGVLPRKGVGESAIRREGSCVYRTLLGNYTDLYKINQWTSIYLSLLIETKGAESLETKLALAKDRNSTKTDYNRSFEPRRDDCPNKGGRGKKVPESDCVLPLAADSFLSK